MEQIKTKYGVLKGIATIEKYGNGQVKECILQEPNIIKTQVGDLIPQHQNDGVRSKYIKSVSFYEDGNLKSISLNNQTSIPTSMGEIPAELLTFYEGGQLKRIFPLNGKITGYWTEENEYELAKEQKLSFSFGEYKKKIINIQFYESGEIKSVTFWPSEKIKVAASFGNILVRIGVSVYPEGQLKSIEPAFPTLIDTPIGSITAYNVMASGINGDLNSLCFNEDGTIASLLTSTDSIEIVDKKDNRITLMPGLKPSLINEEGMDILPMKIDFLKDIVVIDNGIKHTYELDKNEFTIKNNDTQITSQCGDCSNCSACG